MSPAEREKDRERKWWGVGVEEEGRRTKLPLEERKAREKEQILGGGFLCWLIVFGFIVKQCQIMS